MNRRFQISTARMTLAAAIVGLSLFALGPSAARATDAQKATPTTMVVIDGSGSMWGPLAPDKRAKIDIVRDLLKPKIEVAGQSSKIGFTSFGHRKAGTCFDVEVIAAPGSAPDAVLAPLSKLNPRGKGPLVLGLQEAAKAIGTSRPASMIVIGDGADNCQQDACAAADAIAKSAPGVAIHMIAIGVDAADTPRLSCVAKATGGTFADVKDPDGLAKAIDAASQLAMLAPGSAPSEKAGPTAVAPPPPGIALRAVIALKDGGPPISADATWQIFKDFSKEPMLTGSGPEISSALDPGSYEIVAKRGALSARKTVTIKGGDAQVAILPLNAAEVAIKTAATKSGEPLANAFLTLTPADASDDKAIPVIGSGGSLNAIVAPGNYVLTITHGSIRQTKALDLAAGDTAKETILLGTGQIVVSAATRDDGGAIEDVTFIVTEDDPDSADGKREVARSRSPAAEFSLAAGTYYITARSGRAETRQRVAISAGDTLKRALVLPLVPLKITSTIGGQAPGTGLGSILRVSELDGDRREVLHSVSSDAEVLLAPGRYRASLSIPAYRLSAAQDVVLETGKPTNTVLKIDAAEVMLKSSSTVQRPDSFWEILDANGSTVWRSTGAEPKAFIAPGRYTVRLQSRDVKTEAAFDIRTGERRQIELGAK